MIAKDLLKKLKAHRGDLFAECANFDDFFWFKVSRHDVIQTIARRFEPDEETGFTLDSTQLAGYFGKDYKAQA